MDLFRLKKTRWIKGAHLLLITLNITQLAHNEWKTSTRYNTIDCRMIGMIAEYDLLDWMLSPFFFESCF